MKTKILLALILSAGVLFGGTPIDNLKFGTNVDGNNKAITNLSALQLGGVTITNWNTASSVEWINVINKPTSIQKLESNDGGSLTNLSVTESDPKWSAVSNSITTKADNGQTAYGWGNHATNGYLTAESDPIWSIVSNSITTKANNGQTAFSWGNHATNGYLKSESDPKWAAVSNSITTKANNGQTAYGWGNHATNGYLKSESDTLDSVVARGNSTTRTIYPGAIVSSQNGKLIVRSKDNDGSSLWLQGGLSGTESWIQVGKNDMYGSFGPRTGIVAIAQTTESGGTLAPVVFGCSKLGVGDGSVTNILMDSNSGKVNATGGYQWNGTNLISFRQGSIGGTTSVYFVIGGTNYHIRIK